MKHKARQSKNPIVIDYPKTGEPVDRRHYAVRVSTAEKTGDIEGSLDGGPYQPCHNSAGYWWLHLHDLSAGAHTITIRLVTTDGSHFSIRKFIAEKKD
jgi:hypothetical protein